jgi:hypothetical protein
VTPEHKKVSASVCAGHALGETNKVVSQCLGSYRAPDEEAIYDEVISIVGAPGCPAQNTDAISELGSEHQGCPGTLQRLDMQIRSGCIQRRRITRAGCA